MGYCIEIWVKILIQNIQFPILELNISFKLYSISPLYPPELNPVFATDLVVWIVFGHEVNVVLILDWYGRTIPKEMDCPVKILFL